MEDNKEEMFNVHWGKKERKLDYIFGGTSILKVYYKLQGYIQNLFGKIRNL